MKHTEMTWMTLPVAPRAGAWIERKKLEKHIKNILLNTGFLAFVLCGSAGLQISALTGLLVILAYLLSFVLGHGSAL